MVEVIVAAIDYRFRSLFNQELSHRFDRFQYQTEDLIIADYLGSVNSHRVPAVLESLRVAALSTYENRRVSTGAILLGTDEDPTAPCYTRLEGAPSFNARLTAIKGFHRLCDGVRTVFLVDKQGDLARMIDVDQWARAAQGDAAARSSLSAALREPCQGDPRRRPRLPGAFALAGDQGLRRGDAHVQLQRRAVAAFGHSQQVRRLVRGGGPIRVAGLAPAIFQAALNLSESRLGALFVVLRRPERSIGELVATTDQIAAEIVVDDPEDPDNLSPRLAKRALHHVVRGMSLADLEPSVLEAIASVDGAVVTDQEGRLITFGAILRIAPDALGLGRAVQGARTLAGLAASLHGPVLKVSEDGYLTMFLKGRRVWEL